MKSNTGAFHLWVCSHHLRPALNSRHLSNDLALLTIALLYSVAVAQAYALYAQQFER